MGSCYSGDHTAEEHIHRVSGTTNRCTALDRSVTDYGGGGGRGGGLELNLVLLDPNLKPSHLNRQIKHSGRLKLIYTHYLLHHGASKIRLTGFLTPVNCMDSFFVITLQLFAQQSQHNSFPQNGCLNVLARSPQYLLICLCFQFS